MESWTDPARTSVGRMPASAIQRGMWFTEQAGAAGTAYHLGFSIRLAGRLDIPALRRAVDAVLSQHQLLAVGFEEIGGDLWLRPAATKPVLTMPDSDTAASHAETAALDLRTGPLLRLWVTRRAPDLHVLTVRAHHLVFDGISKLLFVRALAASYRTELVGAPDPVASTPTPTPTVNEVMERECERIAGKVGPAREFWRGRWDESPTLVLPEFNQVPPGAGPGGVSEFRLDGTESSALRQGAADLGITSFEFLLSAVLVLLHRYGNPRPAVAVDMSTRTDQTRGLIGLYVNELPLVAPDPAGMTFREFAATVRTELRRMYEFRAVPFAQVVDGLRPRTALTPVTLSYRRQEEPDPEFDGLTTTVDWMVTSGSARSVLNIQLLDHPAGLSGQLQYNRDALPGEAVARIGSHMRTLLAATAADPDRPIATLPLLDHHEWQQVVSGWNQTVREFPLDQTLVDLVRRRARAAPDGPAVVSAGARWSLAEIDDYSERLACLLHRQGAGPGQLVGVGLERSAELLVALLAVAKTGAAYLPLDLSHPPDRIRTILADAEPALVVTATDGLDRLGEVRGAVFFDRLDSLREAPREDRLPPPGPDDLAYVIYTSGSTGTPKGVAVPHRALTNLLFGIRDVLGDPAGEVWLSHTSPGFDISALEIFLPLVSGVPVVQATSEEARDGTALRKLIDDEGITHIQATPSGWRMLLAAGFGASSSERGTVVALVGGEEIPLALAREVRSKVRRMINLYGPTETTVWSTAAELPDPVTEVTIGRPLANTTAYLLDSERRPVPIGVPAELYLGGAGLARGYRGRPDLTAARFVPAPDVLPGSRLYRTGDRAVRLPDGRIAFRGRIDNQVKIRGHRVEPGEVEARLMTHPAVAEAAVAPVTDSDGDVRLIGYLVLAAGAESPSAAQLRGFLSDTLPSAMIPTGWVTLPAMPLTANGKLDRQRLSPPPVLRDETTQAPSDPANRVVEQLREIWREALRLPVVEDDQDLFDLGGHSLTIIQIINEIALRVGVDVPIDLFYETPSIAEIAEWITEHQSDPAVV